MIQKISPNPSSPKKGMKISTEKPEAQSMVTGKHREERRLRWDL